MKPTQSQRPMRLALGPLTYFWPRQKVLDFYEQAARWPVDVVYLGETVCSRRRELKPSDWADIADKMAAAGKEAVLSTYELIETDADLRVMRQVVENGRHKVEANDMGAVKRLADKGPFVAGPFLNIYNAATLGFFAGIGASRWVPPVELSGAGLRKVLAEAPAGIETEVFAWGHLPLALSARCFTARFHDLSKDHCDFRCLHDPDGLPLSTQDGEPFLLLNGVQTQSGRIQNLLPMVPKCREMGVDLLRLSPQSRDMAAIVELFAGVAKGGLDAHEAQRRLRALVPGGTCDGYWHGVAGLEQVEEMAA